MCGELICSRGSLRHLSGSSPRVRGTPAEHRAHRRQGRFIPACAGNSASEWCGAAVGAVHPRVCGELHPDDAEVSDAVGSSPRVRGTRRDNPQLPDGRRFIPACAGNSSTRPAARTSKAVHPRVCGELSHAEVARQTSDGSSPRVRGTRVAAQRSRRAGRFIPACAGNSRQQRGRLSAASGSSPRVRGTRVRSQWERNNDRFIPACAGNSRRRRRLRSTLPVHPRVCGELVTSQHLQQPLRWFIPACAGNSWDCQPPLPTFSVHPRVCGELVKGDPAGWVQGGSSPRVRGTQRGGGRRWRVVRFIPACAGNSSRECRKELDASVHPRVCGELPASPSRRFGA